MATVATPPEAGWYLDEYDTDRFWSRVDFLGGTAYEADPLASAEGECWQWVGATNGKGYGWFRLSGHIAAPHRVAFMDCGHRIPDGAELDHLCRNRSCVNPAHLEPTSHAENVRRGKVGNRTHCPQGHEYTPENTKLISRGDRRVRYCVICWRESRRKSNQRYAAKRRAT